MKHSIALCLLATAVLWLVIACNGRPQTIIVTVEVAVTATAAEPTLEPTATLAPIRATQQAMADAVSPPTRTAPETEPTSRIRPDDYPALVDQACQIVRQNYVRDDFNGVDWTAACEAYRAQAAAIDDQDAFWDLMEKLIDELGDDHSRFVRPDRLGIEFNLPLPGEETGRPWPGLIVWPAPEDQQLLIWHVCQDGPAAAAGLDRGDAILAINGQPVPRSEDGFDQQAVSQALYGESDSAVLTVQPGPGQTPEEVELRFGSASGCDGWRYGLVSQAPRLGYIRIPDFSGNADFNIMTAVQSLEEEGPLDGLILDVRHNPGGNADRALGIFTQGQFGKLGPLRQDATQTLFRIRGPVRWNETTPVALLIDGNSHSAAEYFATAIQQSGRATLVGMPTAGNTEGIAGFNLADGSLIRLAVMTLQLPDGRTLEGTGVQPDILVPLAEWGLRQEPDVQLQAAYEALTTP